MINYKIKSIFVLLILLFGIILVSCGATKETTKETMKETPESTPKTIDTTTTPGEGNNHFDPPSSGEHLMLVFDDLAEYDAYMEKANLPKNFVHYDDIANIGEFELFSCIHPEVVGEENWLKEDDLYNDYYYCLRDGKQGYILHIDIGEDLSLSESKIISDAHVSSDMKMVGDAASGVVLNDSLLYTYLDGNLISVKWTYDGILFTLAFDNQEYGETNIFIKNLLNREKAPDQIKRFQVALAEKKTSK